MLTRRILACLDVAAGRVVKGVQFVDLQDAGDPAELAARHAANGADEIVFLDITATQDNRGALLDAVHAAAQRIFVPFTVGGGVRSLADAAALFNAGADKVSVNSAAIDRPALLTEIAKEFGAQAVVLAIDVKLAIDIKRSQVFANGGRRATSLDPVAWAREAESRGAGEILLTSMDSDGTRAGFDCTLTAAVAQAVRIPVIASGGAGNAAHFVDVFTCGHADAALAASIFHFGIQNIWELKRTLARSGVPVRQERPTC
jgi:cyclase